MQIIRIDGDRVSVQEQITQATGRSTVEVDATLNGEFYKVKGSPLVDEISYVLHDDSIHGTGRKQGVVVLREVVSLLKPDIL